MGIRLTTLFLLLFATPVSTSADGSSFDSTKCALRVLMQEEGEHAPSTAGTAFLVSYRSKHYIVTAYHVVARQKHLFLTDGHDHNIDLRNFVEPVFFCDPAAEICIFQCTKTGLTLLTDERFTRTAIPLANAITPVGRLSEVVGNPSAVRLFGGTESAILLSVLNRSAPAFIVGTSAAAVLGNVVLEEAQNTRIILLTSEDITYGYSGGPVFLSETKQLVGMLVGGDPVSHYYCWAVPVERIISAIDSPVKTISYPDPVWPHALFKEKAITISTVYSAQQYELQILTESAPFLAIVDSGFPITEPDASRSEKITALKEAIQSAEHALNKKTSLSAIESLSLHLAKATVAFAEDEFQKAADLLPKQEIFADGTSLAIRERAQRLRAHALLARSLVLAKQDGYSVLALKAMDDSTIEFEDLAKNNPDYKYWTFLPKVAKGLILAREHRLQDSLAIFREVLENLQQQDFKRRAREKFALVEIVVQGKVLAFAVNGKYDDAIDFGKGHIELLEKVVQSTDDKDAEQLASSYKAQLICVVGSVYLVSGDNKKALASYVSAIEILSKLVFTDKLPSHTGGLLRAVRETVAAITKADNGKSDTDTVRSALRHALDAYKKLLDDDKTIFRDCENAWAYGYLLFLDSRFRMSVLDSQNALLSIDAAIRVLDIPPEPNKKVTKLRADLVELRSLLMNVK